MGDVAGLVVFTAGLAVFLYGLWRFARFARRRGVDSALMGIADDLYHPAASQQQEEHRIEEERVVPRPGAADDE